ncbi:hypothetical protein MBANPS3_002896 [Mucor bainieri]
MKLRKRPQRVQVVNKKADAMNVAKLQLTSNKQHVLRHRTARLGSPFYVKKEEDDYKNALKTLMPTSDEVDTTGVSTVRVKTETKQEDMAKASLRAISLIFAKFATLPLKP